MNEPQRAITVIFPNGKKLCAPPEVYLIAILNTMPGPLRNQIAEEVEKIMASQTNLYQPDGLTIGIVRRENGL